MKPKESQVAGATTTDHDTAHDKVHPVGSGVGAAAGAATGAAVGTAVGGPVGTLVGAAVGAVAGGLVGRGVVRVDSMRIPSDLSGQIADAPKNARLESGWDSEWDQIYPSHSRPGTLQVPLQELHDVRSGRLDAEKFAKYLDHPLTQIAEAMGKKYSAVHKTPAAPDVQPFLQSLKTSLVILEDVLGNRSAVLAWLNSPHPDLGQKTPLDVILEGHPNAVKNMLQAAIIGTPS
jgi:Glycine zipper/Protein of unknown function (DUF2384)